MEPDKAPGQRPARPKRVRIVVQAVIEVPMSRRQAMLASDSVVSVATLAPLKKVELTGHSILRGLTFIELVLTVLENSDLKRVVANCLALFVVEAEGEARRGESEEFALRFAEMFVYGRPQEPEMILLPGHLHSLGIGGTDEQEDEKWSKLLSAYYNPPVRRDGEVKIKRVPFSWFDIA